MRSECVILPVWARDPWRTDHGGTSNLRFEIDALSTTHQIAFARAIFYFSIFSIALVY